MKYKKEIIAYIGDSVKIEGGYIFGKSKNMIAQIRGWGAIQYMFETIEEQEAFQDELGLFITQAINDKLKQL